MSLILHINIQDLLHCSGVESARIEFKAGWDERTTGHQVLKTICAFANDLQNLNGGRTILPTRLSISTTPEAIFASRSPRIPNIRQSPPCAMPPICVPSEKRKRLFCA